MRKRKRWKREPFFPPALVVTPLPSPRSSAFRRGRGSDVVT